MRKLILFLALSWPAAIQAQSVVLSVTMSADLTAGDGSAAVSVVIDFVPDTADLRVELLGFERATAETFRIGATGGQAMRFAERSGSRAWVVIPRNEFESVGLTRAEATTAWRITASYVIRDAAIHDGALVRARVPVLTVALPPTRDAGGVFRAVLRTPPEWSLTESFPTGFVSAGPGEYGVELAVPPSVLSLRARSDGAWRPGVPLVLDVVAGAILLLLLIIGWRHLRAAASAGGVQDRTLTSGTGETE